MRLITISGEYGAGGREIGAQLARALGWEFLDHALLHRAAQLEHVPDAELEALDEQAIGLTDRFRPHPLHDRYIHGLSQAAHQAAAQGNAILVGRGSRQLVGETPDAFHLRLVAPRDWRVGRMAAIEGLSPEQAAARCLHVDRSRQRFERYFFGLTASQPWQYDLVANTGRVPLDQVVTLVVALARNGGTSGTTTATTGGRVLTLARELGAGNTGFAPTLANRLGLSCCDRTLLEREATRLGVPEVEVEKIDESPAGIFDRFRLSGIRRRYFEILGQLMNELAACGDVLLVGRAGSCFLRDQPRAFHVRLVAPMPTRVQRVMEYRWLAQAPARKMIAESDDRRRRFYRESFGTDWSDPLGYSITVNSGRLGPAAVELVARASEQFWNRAEREKMTCDDDSSPRGGKVKRGG